VPGIAWTGIYDNCVAIAVNRASNERRVLDVWRGAGSRDFQPVSNTGTLPSSV